MPAEPPISPRRRAGVLRVTFLCALASLPGVGASEGAGEQGLAGLEKELGGFVRPLIERFCLDCHSTAKQKGELDLERFSSLGAILRQPKVWQDVVEQLSLGEMPPRKSPQPTPQERERLLGWVRAVLDEAALARAGDPGPVILRRLNNAEYTYTVRDLTGVDSLDPAREFPADSAAGEGFMNTGSSLVMSPSLFQKYLDAAKEISAHAVLLPGGFRFSASTTRRDWTEEVLAEIRSLYRRHTEARGGDRVNLQGIVFETNEGGRLPVARYLEATLELRETGAAAEKRLAEIAAERGLSGKYLAALWRLLESPEPSFLLDGLRARWRGAKPEEAAALAAEVAGWQKALWKFSSVGHIGKAGGPKAWMEPVNPLASRQDFRLELGSPAQGGEVVIYLVAGDAGDGAENDFVLWERPRLVAPGRPELLLSEARDVIRELSARRERLFASAAKCLEAAAEASAAGSEVEPAELARRHGVEEEALSAWLEYLGIGASGALELDRFAERLQRVAGYEFINGWGSNDTPSLVANSSDQHVRIPGNMKPGGVAVHPSPKLNAAAAWRSPMAGVVGIEARVTHAHPECGNGIEWSLELRRGKARQRLAGGSTHGGSEVAVGPFGEVGVELGDLISLSIGPRGGNHACDLTAIDLFIRSAGEEVREWSLAGEVSPRVLEGNPLADRHGNEEVWHFYREPAAGGATTTIPAGSLLARWQWAGSREEKRLLAHEVQALLASGPPAAAESPDGALYRQLSALAGPLFQGALGKESKAPAAAAREGEADREAVWGVAREAFGRRLASSATDVASLCVQAPSIIEIRLPADLLGGAVFVTSGRLDEERGAEGSVQLQVTTVRPEGPPALTAARTKVTAGNAPWTADSRQISHEMPILVAEGSAARRRVEAGFEELRSWFPAALCYPKIVPVDEVVTLTLFHREDHHLARLLLDEAETVRLDRLWEELHYISHDALHLVDAFEQIWQYATQDADPRVFEPMRQPIHERAAAFRGKLVESEPAHIGALVDFAAFAYRRPLEEGEADDLRGLYRRLRDQELPHEAAFRSTLARIFVSPAFLYRLEKAGPGAEPEPVSDWELASRLSYFLWSSTPDAELREAAAAGDLGRPEVLSAQARRMLRDPRIRRLAIEFACAWFHIHGFDELDEKSERHFPSFAALRGEMYEEAIRFFGDIFQRDAPVLELFGADHTFLNEALAEHYGIPGVSGAQWRRVDGVRKFGRGGILGLSATLARQAGASRTSPILRGNWVAEALLGEKLPRPPKEVPQLPEDEAAESLSVRQLVERHSADPLCSGCHARIDGYGFALEAYDAIGRLRERDLGDRPIDTRAKLFDGAVVEGVDGLREYLLSQRRDALSRQLCRKLLGYALGRGVMLSDAPLLTEMERSMREEDYRFGALVESIVRSRQFREIRGRDAPWDE
jgi:hypothetical protein